MSAPGIAFGKIEHFFVLMLENRSFDHLFGAVHGRDHEPLQGTEQCAPTPDYPDQTPVPVTKKDVDIARPDPPHEFQDVKYQLTGDPKGVYGRGTALPMNGFAASAIHGLLQGEAADRKAKLAHLRGNGGYALGCQGSGAVPALRKLAREFVLCKRWFSSMPGPTWPNRFFLHAASSGGLDNSPAGIWKSIRTFSRLSFDFEHGTIFDQLGEGGWRIYHKGLPQVLAIQGMVGLKLRPLDSPFRSISLMERDLKNAYIPVYTFIEPYHDIRHESRGCNSQHPEGSLAAGDRLVAQVYDWIRNSSLWSNSALIITYDEHGGFFDRESPPETQPPGDEWRNQHKAKYPATFDFRRLGPRVPAVIVSPWVKRGFVDPTVYEHSSVARTIFQRLERGQLTSRESNAESFAHVFTREAPREDAPVDLATEMGYEAGPFAPAELPPDEARDDELDHDLARGNLDGFLRIAAEVDSELQTQTRPRSLADDLRRIARALPPGLATIEPLTITTRAQALRYIEKIEQQLELREQVLANL